MLRFLLAGVIVAVALQTGAATPSRADADAMRDKLTKIVVRGEQCPCGRKHRTEITEAEVNAYIHHHAAGELPDGVVSPHIGIVGGGRVSGRAIVDLDRVRTSRQRGWLDPAGYLTGRVPVTAVGILHTVNGTAKFELQSATVGGITVPKVVLQELLSYYSRTPDHPSGISLDDTFELPAAIQEIQVGQGVAYVIQ